MTQQICNIVLIGYRGTGKSTVARLVADRLGWEAVDADRVLETRHGRSIRAIFDEEGEAGFRDKESAILEELCRRENIVLATGGGVVVRDKNRARLRRCGWVVWLTADTDTIWQRLQADCGTRERRPDLTAGGRAEIEDLLHRRQPLYRDCADCTVETVGRSPEHIADSICQIWANLPRP